MSTRRAVTFTNAQGLKLAASCQLPPSGRARAWALFAHCFTCSKDLRAARAIADGLAREGFGVMSFDFTGLGQSEGDFADTTFASNLEDLIAAAEFLAHQERAPSLLVGHSLGGTAALHVANEIPSVEAVATIAAPADPEHITKHFTQAEEALREHGNAEVCLAGRPFTITQAFVDSLRQRDPTQVIAKLDAALLVAHSPQDKAVGIEHASRIFQAAMHPKSFLSLDGADHLLTREEDARYAGGVIAQWAQRYVTKMEGESPELSQGQVAARTGRARYHTDIVAGRHELVADEPTDVGGQDHGPSPYDLLLAALGSCTSMTLRMYADRKKWPLHQVTVQLTHEKIRPEPDSNVKIDRIQRLIALEGDLDDAQRERLLEMADRCPVHRTLHGEIRVESRLADEG